MDNLNTFIGIIFGVGGVAFLTAVVTSYRRLRSGKISDDESIISRLYRELERTQTQKEESDERANEEFRDKQWWREQAVRYRIQLIEEGHTPRDLPGYDTHE